MTRAQQAVDHLVAQRLLDVAVERFHRQGYQGTSIRDLAGDAGIRVAVLYEHFPSKQSILLEVIDSSYALAVVQLEAAVAAAGDDPVARLEAAVWAQCDFHTRYPHSARVAETELRNLEPEHRERVLAKRARLWQIVDEIIAAGIETGVFEVSEPSALSRALLTMCAGIGSWYDVGGAEAPRQAAQTYCDLAARMAGVRFVGVPLLD